MKRLLVRLSVLCACLVISSHLLAADCIFSGTRITQIERWDNGEIFIYFSSTDNDCPCQIKSRLAIPAGSTDEFMKSQVLMAFASKTTVNAVGRPREDGYCTVHGNTAALVRFRLIAD